MWVSCRFKLETRTLVTDTSVLTVFSGGRISWHDSSPLCWHREWWAPSSYSFDLHVLRGESSLVTNLHITFMNPCLPVFQFQLPLKADSRMTFIEALKKWVITRSLYNKHLSSSSSVLSHLSTLTKTSLYNLIPSCIYCLPTCILLMNLDLFLFAFVILIRITIRLLMLYLTNNVTCDYLVCFHCYDSCLSVIRADKIPAAQYSSYVESCQKQRQQDCGYSLSRSFVVSWQSLTIILYLIFKKNKKNTYTLFYSNDVNNHTQNNTFLNLRRCFILAS